MKQQLEFQIIFKGEIDYLDSDLIIANLISTTDIIQEINRELGGPNIKINIKPFAPGSFQIDFGVINAAIASGITTLFTRSNIDLARDLFGIFVSLYTLKKHLRGERPARIESKDDSVTIINDRGGQVTVNKKTYNLYASNRPVNENLRKAFHSLDKSEGVEALQINDSKNRELVYVPKEDFAGMAQPNSLVLEAENCKIVENANLVIFKIVFDPGYKWGFYYGGMRISAKILDKEFFNEIQKHSFSEGDHLVADLKIVLKYDDFYKIDIIQRYEILKIKQHIKSEENTPLPL